MSDAPSGPGDPGGQVVRGCPACGARLPAAARFCPSCGRSVEPGPSDERRPVTILFLDIVGSTAIAERLDAEDWKAMVDPALATFTAIVERNGGRVAQLLGDGLLAFFGAPVAHEDDAARAVRAGLDLVGAARALGRPAIGSPAIGSDAIGSREIRLEIRVGINTGEVVVGAVGGEGRSEYLAVGDAVNVAARFQSAAPPMGVLISAETHRLVATEVEGRPVGPLALKGKAEPVSGFEVVAIKAVGGHGRRVREGTPLVGREHELAGLVARGELLRAGVGGVVSILGEPGIGKTRLLREWRRALAGPESGFPQVRWIEASCPTIGQGLPYRLARECLRSLLGIARDAEPARMRQHVESAAAGLADLEDAVPLLARLLDLPPTPDDEAALTGLDGRAVQRRLARAFRAVFEEATSTGPIVLVAEDIHWIDPSSAELVAGLLPAVRSRPLIVCLTRRPAPAAGSEELERALADLPAEARLELNLRPLDSHGERRLAAELLGAEDVPEAARLLVLDRCDGNPLFVEQLVATLLERGLLRREDDSWWVDPRASETIPPDLRSLLLARLDALPRDVHRLAMISSVIGRNAPLDLLRAVALEAGEPEAASKVGGRIDEGAVLERAGPDGEVLTFRHALIHEAAYSSLVRADRRRIHRIVGRHLEEAAEKTGRLDEMAATLAHHFSRAEDREPTIRYARIAAERASASYANGEALALYGTAVVAAQARVAAGSHADGDREARIDLARLLEARCALLALVGRVDEAEASYSEALALVPADQVAWRARLEMLVGSAAGDRGRFAEAQAHYLAAETTLGARPPDDDPGWWKTWIDIRGKRVDRAYWLADTNEMEQLIASLEGPIHLRGTPSQRASYHDLMASYLQRRDRYVPSQEVLDHKLASAVATAELGDRRSMAWARFTLGFTCTWNLDFDAAERELVAALADAERIGDALLEARSITYLSIVLRRQGRIAETLRMAERTIAASRPLGVQQYVAIALANRAWAELRLGDVAAARRDAETAERAWPAEPPYPFRWLDLWPLIAVDVADGRPSDALPRCRALLDPALQPPAKPVAEALTTILEVTDDPPALAAAFQVALDRAREHTYL